MSIHDDLEGIKTDISKKDDIIKEVVNELQSIDSGDDIDDILKTISAQVDVLVDLASDLYWLCRAITTKGR